MKIQTFLKNKDARRNTTFVIPATGEPYYLYKGAKYSEAEFIRKFPIDQPVDKDPWKKENPDGTKAWML